MLHYLYSGIFALSIIINISCDKHSTIPVKKDMEQNSTLESFDPWINTDYVMGKFDPKNHSDFVEIDIKYADRAGLFLRKEAYDSFIAMWSEAKKDDLTLTIKSATRNFTYQRVYGKENGMD